MQGLIKALQERQVVLFVGAGVSNCLGVPTWDQLIQHMAHETGYDPEIFWSLGDHYSLAEYYALQKKGLGSLRSWMDRKFHDPSIDVSKSRVHRLITELRCRWIYTTNYDTWLERAHKEFGKKYHKISGIGDLAGGERDAVEIIKFHGDFDDDDSLVLTETSYFERLAFDSPLDIRFRSDTIGRTLLFIGYGLRDINTRLLLYKLNRLWRDDRNQSARPKSFIFMITPNPIQETILLDRGIEPLIGEHDEPKTSLETFLAQLVKEAFGVVIA